MRRGRNGRQLKLACQVVVLDALALALADQDDHAGLFSEKVENTSDVLVGIVVLRGMPYFPSAICLSLFLHSSPIRGG